MKKNFFRKIKPAKPDCRGNRLNSETFYFGFFSKIEFSSSLYKKTKFWLRTFDMLWSLNIESNNKQFL